MNGLTVFLASSGRKVKPIIGDGNCLFRTLSDQLFNTQDEHLLVRTTLVRLENLNKSVFQNYLLSQVNTNTITSHIESILRLYVWGTDMEVIAAASLFQIPVYFTKESDPVDGEYHWQAIYPLPSEKLRYPKIVDHPLLKWPHLITLIWCTKGIPTMTPSSVSIQGNLAFRYC